MKKDDPMIKDIISYIINFANENELQVCDYSYTNTYLSHKVQGMLEILEHLTGKDVYFSYDWEKDDWAIGFEEDDE